MNLPTDDALSVNDDLTDRELSVEELEAIAAGAGHHVEYDNPSSAHYEV